MDEAPATTTSQGLHIVVYGSSQRDHENARVHAVPDWPDILFRLRKLGDVYAKKDRINKVRTRHNKKGGREMALMKASKI